MATLKGYYEDILNLDLDNVLSIENITDAIKMVKLGT